MRGARTAAVILTAALLCGCSAEEAPQAEIKKYPQGTGERLEGRILVVSVFCSDFERQWNTESADDLAIIDEIRGYIGTAMEYLENEAARYGKELEMVYDWEEHEDLRYFRNIPTENAYISLAAGYEFRRSVSLTIDYEALMEKYGADGIVFYSLHNTPYGYEGGAYAEPYGYYSDFEAAYIGYKKEDFVYSPLVYAHELLHLFGARDLYIGRDFQGITQEYADYTAENNPNDIMFATNGYIPNEQSYLEISEEVTDITAYYLGWIEECEDVERFGLIQSDFEVEKE